MTKWVTMLGGGSAAAAAVGAGLYLSGALTPSAPVTPDVAVVAEPETASFPPTEDTPTSPPPHASEQPVALEDTVPEADNVKAPDPDPEPEVAALETPQPPRFDVVRIDPDGAALVAGQGLAEAEIRVLLNRSEIARAASGRDGKFVSLFDIDPSDQPRMLSLAMRFDGQDILSETEVIVAPFGVEEKLALAEIETSDPPLVEDTPAEAPEQGAEADRDGEADARENDMTGGEAETRTPDVDDTADTEMTETGSTESDPAVDEDLIETASAPEGAPEPEIEVTPEASETVVAEDVPDTSPAPVDAPVDAPVVAEAPVVSDAPQPDDDPVKIVETDTPVMDDAGDDTPKADDTPAEAPEAPPTLLASDEDGVRVLAGPEVLDAVAIDTISYDEEGDVALAGRGAVTEEGGFVRVYLDNTPITTSRIREDGSWQVELPEVDKGVYTLRVDEVDDEGDVKSRTETPFQREDRETLERVAEAEEAGAPVRIVTVQPGNTLWQIARDRYGEGLLYVRVFNANKSDIRNPDLIYPGQVFDLPDASDTGE